MFSLVLPRDRGVVRVRLPVPQPAEAPSRSAGRHPHWQGLDGLRAVAVAAVVVFHFWPRLLPGGYLGVDVFFVISGYLITRLLTREYVADHRLDIGNFYRRRARRLLPALALVLAAISVAALVWRDQLATLRPGVLATAVFGGNWWLIFSHQPYFVSIGRPSMLRHLWSLAVEEQYYLLWPLLLITVMRLTYRRRADPDDGLSRGTRRLAAVALVGALLSTGLTWLLADLSHAPYNADLGSTLYYGTHTHCMGLLLGAALGAATVAIGGEDRLRRLSRRLGVSLDLLGVAGLGLLGYLLWSLDQFSMLLYRGGLLLVAAAVAVVIAAAARPDSRLGRALDVRWLRWIGVRSYSIYLWHWPIAVVTRPGLDNHLPVAVDQLIRVALTLLLSDLSYRYVETPVRRAGLRRSATLAGARLRQAARAWPPGRDALVAGSCAVLAAAGVGVLVAGPSAPAPPPSIAASSGGRNLALSGPHLSPVAARQDGPKVRRRHGSHAGASRVPIPKISGFGDSVLLGARGVLGQTFAGGRIDAVEGRQPGPILADVRAQARAGTLNPLVILHVGDNGPIDPAALSRTLHLVAADRGVRLVVVLTDHIDGYSDPWQDPNNNLISRVVPKFRVARVVRWNQEAADHPGWLYPDGVHLTPAGATGYARLIEAAWRQAAG